ERSDEDRPIFFSGDGGVDAVPETAIKGVGETLINGEQQRAEKVRARVPAELRRQTGGYGFVHFCGERRGDRLFLERVDCVRTSAPSRPFGERCEDLSEGRAKSAARPKFSKRTRADRSPRVTLAPPFPSSSLMTPTRPANGPPRTRTLAPTRSAGI